MTKMIINSLFKKIKKWKLGYSFKLNISSIIFVEDYVSIVSRFKLLS